MKNIRVVIITGLSGSGKSTALRALEDVGFFCVDNLPSALLSKLLELQAGVSGEITKLALVMDLREKNFPETFINTITKLKKQHYNIEVLFLDAGDECLLNRFSETRRSHPLSAGKTVLESIRAEREQLASVRDIADNVIDTSLYNVHQLKDLIQRIYISPGDGVKLVVNLMSFGYRYGLPPDADLVFDVRFLPNPFFVNSLKNMTGIHKDVEDYVMKWDETKAFLDKLCDMLSFLMPLFVKEGKAYLNIASGCTGGKHRSVVVTEHLSDFIKRQGYSVHVTHRDIDRG